MFGCLERPQGLQSWSICECEYQQQTQERTLCPLWMMAAGASRFVDTQGDVACWSSGLLITKPTMQVKLTQAFPLLPCVPSHVPFTRGSRHPGSCCLACGGLCWSGQLFPCLYVDSFCLLFCAFEAAHIQHSLCSCGKL